ncbi:hypothetical protein [Flavobacterium sp.]|uniref:hypothetical protein n=1 Tax=Flavobacterium sp. TaxID=239 RepID=UPI0025BE9EC9|nr:hypothetical protein [Flavobacterium sp.]MBA4154150.1 hypothetical protein [Flavobacterium sp.]
MANMQSKIIERYKEETKRIYNKKFGVIFDGEDNLKPVVVENLIDSSPTALQCAWINERFLGGAGFEVDLSKVNISDGILPYSPNNLLFDVCEPLSRHQGVWVHVGYNFNYEKDSFNVIPYSLCKLGEKDSKDYNGKILLSRKGWGKDLKKDQVEVYDVYNPRPEVIQTQVDAAGGWNNYKGQIFFFKLNDKYDYPKSKIETAYTFADTENQLGLFYNGTARRSFEDITIIRHRQFPKNEDKVDFYKNLEKMSGFENTSSKLVVEDDFDDERDKTGNFKFDTLKNEVRSEKYAHFETSSSNYIRKVYNIPPQLIDFVAGKLGNTSGEDLTKAQSIYNSIISRDQEKIELFFAELFKNHKDNINPSGNWTIKQYSLLEDGTVNYEQGVDITKNSQAPQPLNDEQLAQKEIRVAQATLRGSVGGVTTILAIQLSVSNKTTTFDSAVAMLENIYGYSNEVAKRMIGEPVILEPTNPDKK